ncbi:MAG: polyprenyl diphosphate synthase [Gemmatimonadaceae bacterium]
MTQSHSPESPHPHVAIIMDGNGRWATSRGLPRTAGHRAGADAVRRVVEAAPRLGIRTLTLFAFSSDNWKRPPREVASLMRLFQRYMAAEVAALDENGVRFSVIGRRDRLSPRLVEQIEAAERLTAHGQRVHLRLAVDYSSRGMIERAARGRGHLAAQLGPDVDLLIRTGGERRLSDFLLWECAYAELHFTERRWPDFSAGDLERALADFHGRERRFGALSAAV